MAGLLCKCGEGMNTTDDPSPCIVDIYYSEEVESALTNAPDTALNDFLTDWDEKHDCPRESKDRPEPVDYWFCPVCKRIYEMQLKPEGRWLRIFQKTDIVRHDLKDWRRIYVFFDTDVYAATAVKGANWRLPLRDYLKTHDSPHYFLSPDETLACAIDPANGQVLYSYALEDSWSPESEK